MQAFRSNTRVMREIKSMAQEVQKNDYFAPKDTQRILSLLKIAEKYFYRTGGVL